MIGDEEVRQAMKKAKSSRRRRLESFVQNGYLLRALMLENLPTLAVGQADDLKLENENVRVWLCRCGVADGMPYDNQITVEWLEDGRWVTTEQYEG